MAYEADRRIITSFQTLKAEARDRIERYVIERWGSLGSWRDADVDKFVREVVPIILSGQQTTAQLTNAYLDALARAAGVEPAPMAPALGYPRGIAPEEVYRRGATTLYTGLSEGKTFDAAFGESVNRLKDIIRTDMQMAHTYTAQGRMSADERVVGYRRVLTGAENCALCALASTQRYHKADLMPIHGG